MKYSEKRTAIFNEKERLMKRNIFFVFFLIIFSLTTIIGSFFVIDFMQPTFYKIFGATLVFIFILAKIFAFYYDLAVHLDKKTQLKLDALNEEKNAISMEKLS